MAQRVHRQLVDDVSGEEAEETVRFSLDGIDYEIDLTQQNADTLRAVLSGYVGKARTAGPGRPTPSNASSREETQQIRRWAQDSGYNPSARGRITTSIIDAYNESR
jgi:hypothetical protein